MQGRIQVEWKVKTKPVVHGETFPFQNEIPMQFVANVNLLPALFSSAVAARPESESPLSTSTVHVPLPHATVDKTTPDVVTTQPGALLRRPTRLGRYSYVEKI